jgi:hypothetical protein
MNSLAPVTPAQFSLPGSERISATSPASELTSKLTGTDTAMTVLDTRVIGTRSLGLYGRLSWRNGCAVKEDAGDINSTWSSWALTNALIATRPSPPGRLSTITGCPQRCASRSANSLAPISVPLPGPSDRIQRTGRVGQSDAADAVAGAARTAIAPKMKAESARN